VDNFATFVSKLGRKIEEDITSSLDVDTGKDNFRSLLGLMLTYKKRLKYI